MQRIREYISTSSRPRRPVTGIFEASIATATEICPPDERWVVVTTAESWREELAKGVFDVIGRSVQEMQWDHRNKGFVTGKFGGVETTGLTAGELHTASVELVDNMMAEALGRLVDAAQERRKRVSVVVLGCAGMVGWEEKIRGEMDRRFRSDMDSAVLVVDPVKAGIGSLQSALRAKY